MLYVFGEALENDSYFPSGKEIQNLISTTPVRALRTRTIPQIRTWLHIQKKRNLQDTSEKMPIEKRNRIPNFIYSIFGDHIHSKSVPNVDECINAYKQSPTIQKYTVADIQDYVKKAILFDK